MDSTKKIILDAWYTPEQVAMICVAYKVSPAAGKAAENAAKAEDAANADRIVRLATALRRES
jgi:hypothetical protein